MKILVCLLFTFGCLSLALAGTTPISDGWNQMWFDGKKSEILAKANQRLQSNPNDLAGLVITLEYQMEFTDMVHIKSTMDRILDVGKSVSTTAFSKLFPQLKSDFAYMETYVLPEVTPQIAQAEAGKGKINGKPMTLLYVLQAAEQDGLISSP